MLEKIKGLGNLPLIIVLIVVVIIAIVLSVVKFQKADDTNADAYVSNAAPQENEEEPEVDIIATEIIDEEQEGEDTGEEETPDVDAKYFIRVNYGQNVVTIYVKDTNGEYTIPYKAMVCSTGTATPRSGTYTIPSGTYSRGTWGMMIGNVWAQYFTRIKGSILFHSVPYTERNKWSLEYWEYDKLGTAASAGCIRLTVQDAKWIYNNCPAGTQVEFYTDSNPGPLGKPAAQKISEEEPVRGWDPTDPEPTNPWKTYTPSQEEEPEENNTATTTTPTTPTTPDESPEQNTKDESITPGDENNTSEGNQENEGATDEEATIPDEGTTGEENTNPDETETPDSDVQVPQQSGNSEENKDENEGTTGGEQESPGTTEETKIQEDDTETNQVTDVVNE